MRPLILGAEQHARIAAVKAHAESNVISLARVYRMAHGSEASYYSPEFMALIPVGFRVVYGIEEQPVGTFRHLSVSIEAEDRLPNMIAVEAILVAFGMPPLVESACVYTEPHRGNERRNIVNVLAPYEAGKP